MKTAQTEKRRYFLGVRVRVVLQVDSCCEHQKRNGNTVSRVVRVVKHWGKGKKGTREWKEKNKEDGR